jgi:hypothetical protein
MQCLLILSFVGMLNVLNEEQILKDNPPVFTDPDGFAIIAFDVTSTCTASEYLNTQAQA